LTGQKKGKHGRSPESWSCGYGYCNQKSATKTAQPYPPRGFGQGLNLWPGDSDDQYIGQQGHGADKERDQGGQEVTAEELTQMGIYACLGWGQHPGNQDKNNK